ncbi:hypothetical protein D9M69_606460 [compost metagenome]
MLRARRLQACALPHERQYAQAQNHMPKMEAGENVVIHIEVIGEWRNASLQLCLVLKELVDDKAQAADKRQYNPDPRA